MTLEQTPGSARPRGAGKAQQAEGTGRVKALTRGQANCVHGTERPTGRSTVREAQRNVEEEDGHHTSLRPGQENRKTMESFEQRAVVV